MNETISRVNLKCTVCISLLVLSFLAPSVYGLSGDSASDQSVKSVLTRGWDVFNEPLSSGDVTWRVYDGNTLEVVFTVRGARPNHTYTVGSHLFGSQPFRVNGFLGYNLGTSDATSISREGRSAYVIAYDFGKLTTDSLGNGTARFSGRVPAGNYPLQFTVRIGECLPLKGITGGCATVFRTGEQFAGRLENIRIGQ